MKFLNTYKVIKCVYIEYQNETSCRFHKYLLNCNLHFGPYKLENSRANTNCLMSDIPVLKFVSALRQSFDQFYTLNRLHKLIILIVHETSLDVLSCSFERLTPRRRVMFDRSHRYFKPNYFHANKGHETTN